MPELILEFTRTDGESLRLTAELNGSAASARLLEILPREVDLRSWGQEVYGELGASLPEESLQASLNDGDLAYTSQGNLFCVFFGQQPAWPVQVIGKIVGETRPLKSGSWVRCVLRPE